MGCGENTIDRDGRTEKQPSTEQEWLQLRRSAVLLLEACNLVEMSGRRISPMGEHYVDEADPQVLQLRFEENRRRFLMLTELLRTTGSKAMKAIDRRDSAALMGIGSDVDSAREACHVAFWYPPELDSRE